MYNSISVVSSSLQLENAIRCLGTISPDGSISHITGGNFAKGYYN
jgi:hypothetical protein